MHKKKCHTIKTEDSTKATDVQIMSIVRQVREATYGTPTCQPDMNSLISGTHNKNAQIQEKDRAAETYRQTEATAKLQTRDREKVTDTK